MEGEWSPVAYQQAVRRAWARTHGVEAHRLRSKPEPFVAAGYVGEVGVMSPEGGTSISTEQDGLSPEILPVPDPNTDPNYAPPVPAAAMEIDIPQDVAEPESKNPFVTTKAEEAVKVLVGSEEKPETQAVRRVSGTQDDLPISDNVDVFDMELRPASSFVE